MASIPSSPVDGNVLVKWVPAIADTNAPKLTELNAITALDISCYLTGDGWTPGLDEGTTTDNRLCDRQTYERRGRVTRSLTTTYIENPGDATNNKASTTLVAGTNGFFVVRRGPAYDQVLAVGDKVDVWPIQSGEQSEVAPEANSVFRLTQKQFVTGPKRTQVAVVA